jgi:hypothetical protein
VIFFGHRANTELVPKIHAPLHVSHAALPKLTLKFPTKQSHSNVIKISSQCYSPNKKIQPKRSILFPLLHSPIFYPLFLPKILPCFQPTFTRRTSGHGLGTLKEAFFTPVIINAVPLLHLRLFFFFLVLFKVIRFTSILKI